jgi:hypothetical protein
MGKELFAQLYELLEMEMQVGTDHNEMQKMIKKIVGGKPELIKLCENLEEIIYWEQNFTYA